VLPFILSGLGLAYLDYVRRPAAIGQYIKELWTALDPTCQWPCWERHLDQLRPARPTKSARPDTQCRPDAASHPDTGEAAQADELSRVMSGAHRFLSILPFLLVFLVPAVLVLIVGCVYLTRGEWQSGLWALWALGLLLVVVLFVVLAVGVLTPIGRWRPAAWD
jgi:hypothetical protein